MMPDIVLSEFTAIATEFSPDAAIYPGAGAHRNIKDESERRFSHSVFLLMIL
jgi:hypothetical protein